MNKIDEFLKQVETNGQEKENYVLIYERPSKIKSFFGFIISLIVLIACIFLLLYTLLGILITLIDLIILIYYGSNLFTRNGFGLYKKVKVIEKNDKK